MLLNRFIKTVTSLRLTVVLLAFGILLVFIGTIAQVDEGLYNAQARYFRQWFVIGLGVFGKRLPIILPGGYLIGTLLLVNLVAAHIYRFKLTPKKIGIQLAHSGVILLLVGQLLTDMLAHETQMWLTEGQATTYSFSPQNFELAFTTDGGAGTDQVIAIPAELLLRQRELKNENLPFTIRLTSYWKNSEPTFRAPMMTNAPPLTTNGVAKSFDFGPADETKKMDERNIPTAVVEFLGAAGSQGVWVVSGWGGDESMVSVLGRSYARSVGPQMAQSIVARMTAPQTISVGGKQFTFVLRPQRTYHPFSMTLLKATHTVYAGTDIPKDFRSNVRLANQASGEKREVEIYMNNPLRYAGLAFYQYQMGAGEEVREAGQLATSTLQVVRNPGWITPYLGCFLVAAGLVIQFMFHLVGFISKRSAR
jgi:hypothetical protein